MYVSVPSSLLIVRSTCGVGVSVSVAVLLPVFVSVVPDGGDTVTVFVIAPVADEKMAIVCVKVSVPPLGMSAVVLMPPTPETAPVTDAPPVDETKTQVPLDACAGNVSKIDAPVTSLGPLLV